MHSKGLPHIHQPDLKNNGKVSFPQAIMSTAGVIMTQKRNSKEAVGCVRTFSYKVYPSIPETSTEKTAGKKMQKEPIFVVNQRPIPCKESCKTRLDLHCFDPALGEAEVMEFYVKSQDICSCSCEEVMQVDTVRPNGTKKSLGKIVTGPGCDDQVFKVYDTSGTVVFSLIGGVNCKNCCSVIKFDFYKGLREQKLENQLIRYPKADWLSDKGIYEITFPKKTSYEQRCLCLALAIMVDLEVFQRNGSHPGQYGALK